MAPLPDNDKAPDKTEKDKQEKDKDKSQLSSKDEKTHLSELNDKELKALLDEAITYKNPKDREGKSELFNDLLLQAEETERIARATSAGGSELVRYCNPAARRQRHGGGPRGRRYGGPSNSGLTGRSVSERGTHGGSLDNLAKEELYEGTCRRLRGARKSSTSSSGASSSYGCNQVRVSARQREGGSLPCNVNSGDPTRDFLEESRHILPRLRPEPKPQETEADMEQAEFAEDDVLARNFEERLIDGGGPSRGGSSTQAESSVSATIGGPKYTTKATLQIQQPNRVNVDEELPLSLDHSIQDRKKVEELQAQVLHSKYQVIIPTYTTKARDAEDKKVDENGNALHQFKQKKKNRQRDKNVVELKSEEIQGHKSDIIDNVKQLVHYIEGTTEPKTGKTIQHSSKSKQLHKQHMSEDGATKAGKKRHSKGKEGAGGAAAQERHELKKSNSLGEISGMKLDRDLEAFGSSGKNKEEKEQENVVLRGNKSSGDRTRERRSWGNVEQTLYNASSMENLETSTENWGVVTRTKKKSKKQLSSTSGARHNSSASGVSSSISSDERRARRSPDLGSVIGGVSHLKTTRSMPHSEKSNDSSSDGDSVHSLPMDVHSLPMDGPISYADIAKNSEKKKPSPEKQQPQQERAVSKENSPAPAKSQPVGGGEATPLPTSPPVEKATPEPTPTAVPDVHNIKSFPAIQGSGSKTVIATQTAATSDKAVQSTLSYEDTFVREKSLVMMPADVTEVVSETPKKKATTPKNAHGDVTNDLALFSQLMRESAHFGGTSLRMPVDIVDVATIEKMQFMNCSHTYVPPPFEGHAPSTRSKRKKSAATAPPPVCDSTPRMVNGVSDDSHEMGSPSSLPSPPPVVILSGLRTKEVSGLVFGFEINEQLLAEDSSGGGEASPSSDISANERHRGEIFSQNVAECHGDRFASMYRPPKELGPLKHNHDKITHYLSKAWDDVINSGAEFTYYSSELTDKLDKKDFNLDKH